MMVRTTVVCKCVIDIYGMYSHGSFYLKTGVREKPHKYSGKQVKNTNLQKNDMHHEHSKFLAPIEQNMRWNNNISFRQTRNGVKTAFLMKFTFSYKEKYRI